MHSGKLRGSFIRSALLAGKLKSRAIRIFPGTRVNAGSSVSIEGDGRLELGVKWPGLRYGPGVMKLDDRATLYLNGGMSIYTAMQITVASGARLTLGSGYINSGLRLDCYASISIGRSVAIGPEVIIRDSDNHSIDGRPMHAPVVIEDHVWIGARAMILKGVRVGKGAVVSAGAVVTRDVPAGVLVGGVPARTIRENIKWE